MIEIAIGAALGAVLNRVRGGGFWLGPKLGSKADDAVAFAFGLFLAALGAPGWLVIAGMAGFWVGENLGWGAYIGAIQRGGKAAEEVSVIDILISSLADRPRTWGLAGLTLRGGFWGLCLVMISPWMILAGLTMGAVYRGVMILPADDDRRYWAYGEVAFGAVLWGAAAGLA